MFQTKSQTKSACVRDIFAALGPAERVKLKPRKTKKGELEEERIGLKVAGRTFEKKQRVLDAINDIGKMVNRIQRAPPLPLLRVPKPPSMFAHQFLKTHPEFQHGVQNP